MKGSNVVDKELLYEFLLIDEDLMGAMHLEEVYKVINICLNKYAGAYFNDFSELKGEVFVIMLERRHRFNPGQDAYNYLYTQARNEIGNCIYRWKKEKSIEDAPRKYDKGYDQNIGEEIDIPEGCKKYIPYLTCEQDFVTKRIARKDVVDLLTWLMCKEKKKKEPLPLSLASEPNVANVLYKLLKDLINYG